MAYSKTNWVNNTTPIDKDNLNKIEQGIYDNSLVVDAVTNTLNPTDTETYKTAELTEGQITDVIGVSDIVIKGQTSQNGEPTPSSPVDVNVVSGSNVVKLSSKNLLDGATWNKNQALDESNTAFTANGWEYSNYIDISQANYYYSSISGGRPRTILYDKNKNVIAVLKVSFNTVYNLSSYKAKYIRVSTTTSGKERTKVYQGKEFPLDLGNIELCKIGNYQDYFYKSGSKWYLHKEVGKVVLDGSEGWRIDGTLTNTLRMALDNTNMTPNALSNNFTYLAQYNTDSEHFYITDAKTLKTFILKTTASDLANYKTWLASNNVTLYYALETATNTEITDTTLISQLEAIYNVPLYEQTNITQTNNDLPMILDITACKDNIKGIKAFIRK